MSSVKPKQYLIGALLISVLVHIVLIICLVYWGHLKLKPVDPSRLNIQFSNSTETSIQVIAESPPSLTTRESKKSNSDPNVESVNNSSGWGMQREQKRNIASVQKDQMESRIGFERMRRQGNINISIANIINSLQGQGVQISCDLRLSEDFSYAKITCLPPAIEGYIQSLLGPANLHWDNNEGAKPICISIQSLSSSRKTCQ